MFCCYSAAKLGGRLTKRCMKHSKCFLFGAVPGSVRPSQSQKDLKPGLIQKAVTGVRLGETTGSKACKASLGTRPALLSISCPQGSELRSCRKLDSGEVRIPFCTAPEALVPGLRLWDMTSPPQDFRPLVPRIKKKPLEDSTRLGNPGLSPPPQGPWAQPLSAPAPLPR